MNKYWALIFIKVVLLFAIKYGNAQGLWDRNDYVVKLNITSFKLNVPNSKSSWLIRFYSSQYHRKNKSDDSTQLAPIWKKLAKNMHYWRTMVRVAAVDCGRAYNSRLCAYYGIQDGIRSYPQILFLPANSKYSKKKVKKISMNSHTTAYKIQYSILNLLVTEQKEDRGSSWPMIVPSRSQDESTSWDKVRRNVQHIILIVEHPGSFVGTNVALYYRKASNLFVRRMLSPNKNRRAELLMFSRNGAVKIDNIGGFTSIQVINLVGSFIKNSGQIAYEHDRMEKEPVGQTNNKIHKLHKCTLNKKIPAWECSFT